MRSERGTSLKELICEAVATLSSLENPWVPLRKLRTWFCNLFHTRDPDYVDKKVRSYLKKMVRQGILSRKGNSFSLLSADTNVPPPPPRRGRPRSKKEPAPEKKNMGPDVVITKSGRVSLKTGTG